MITIELTGKIVDLSLDFATGKPKLQVVLNEKQAAFAMYEEFKDCEKLSLDISKYREKRSLNANSYLWVLCDKLAKKLSDEKVKHTKEDIYRKAIKEIGVCRQVEIDEKAADTLCHSWGLHGLGWFSEKLDYGEHEGFVLVTLYYGSSTYNKKQMSRLIDNIVQDCQAVGIETKTPEELARLKDLWGEER